MASHRPLPPGSRIGILGGGQLGRMLTVAASRLGHRVSIYSDGDENPAFDVAADATRGAYDDRAGLEAFADGLDVITYEFENVPVEAAAWLTERVPVYPKPGVLRVAQDRLAEKTFISERGIGVAPFANVESIEDVRGAGTAVGAPAILKTRRMGYDGKGQVPVSAASDIEAAWVALHRQPCVLEARIGFEAELSVLVVRGQDGATRTYDCPRNTHAGGILRTSTVPSGLPEPIETHAKRMATDIASALDYVGVLGVEFFCLPDAHGQANAADRLLVNEIAPRVHNSGHWTSDACACDQFENHIRAVCGWPLGPTDRDRDVEMRNLIGDDVAMWDQLAAEENVRVHLYGKRDARPGRKMGHVNTLT
ncbi:MAG: 5-(carboxyamino)imidazole ribonucleotide synthase [Pseudomonadota bacterium]